MDKLLRGALIVVTVAGAGCLDMEAHDDDTGDTLTGFDSGHEPGQLLSDPVAICDGSEDLRLAARMGIGGFVSDPRTVAYGNGSRFVYVDGRCRYWISGLVGQALTGTLDRDEADLLTSRLGVGAWAEFEGHDWSGEWYDAPPLQLWTPSGSVHCSRECQGSSLPEPLSLISDALRVEVERLGEAGAHPLDGPIRVQGWKGSGPGDTAALEWTYRPPIADFSYDDEAGIVDVEPALITDPAVVGPLRRAWLDARESGPYDHLTVNDEAGALYTVYARDLLPFENDDAWGGVALPP